MKAWNKRKIKYKKCKIINNIWDFENITSCFGFKIKIEKSIYIFPNDYFKPLIENFVTVNMKYKNILAFSENEILENIDFLKDCGFNFRLSNEFLSKFKEV